MNEILKINPVWFKYNGLAGTNPDKNEVGVLANEILVSSPYMISKLHDSLFGDFLGLNNSPMIYLLINSVKELKSQSDTLNVLLKRLLFSNNRSISGSDSICNFNNNVDDSELFQNVPNPFESNTKIKYHIT